MSYYPKTIKKDPLYNWKGVEKYRDENSGKLPAQEARGTKKIPTLDNIIKVNQNPEKGYCACGKKLHYDGEVSKEYYTKLFERVGQFIEIEDSKGRKFKVQRHYIALHGIDDNTLYKLGFLQTNKKQ